MFAVISDIHSNLEALTAVLGRISAHGVKRIICLGDIVGYGPDPLACIELIRENCEVTLKGNHDLATLTQGLGFNSIAKSAIDWTRNEVKPGNFLSTRKKAAWKFLESLPNSHKEDCFTFYHGSPRDDITEYVEEEDVADMGFGVSEKIKDIMSQVIGICFVGHTHKAGVIDADYIFHNPLAEEDFYWDINETPAIVNPGSVGQPRDGDIDASYVLVDSKKISFERVPYDREVTVDKIKKNDALDNHLAERLLKGR